ncbi:MAG: hypothetical protein GF344_06330 [Chitinivibrionales bacterium]|nr:hypothetical protein [Chitinivibrionales bacterium]
MRPVLFSIFGVQIPSYPIMLLLAFVMGIILAANRAKKRGSKPSTVYWLAISIFFGSMAGMKVYAVVLQLAGARYTHAYFRDIESAIALFTRDTGLVAIGGVIGGFLAAAIHGRIAGIRLSNYADTFAVSLALGFAVGRIGCFLSGCCYGAPCTSSLFCINWPAYSAAGRFQHLMSANGLFPSQLFAAFNALIIAAVLLWYGKKRRAEWSEFRLFILLYCLSRFVVDTTRHYPISERIFGLSHNQMLSVCVVGIIMAVWCFRVRAWMVKSSSGWKATSLSTLRGHLGIAVSALAAICTVTFLGVVGMNANSESSEEVYLQNASSMAPSPKRHCNLTLISRLDAVVVLAKIPSNEAYRVYFSNGKAKIAQGKYQLRKFKCTIQDAKGESWNIRSKLEKPYPIIDVSNLTMKVLTLGPPLKSSTQVSLREQDSLCLIECNISDYFGNKYKVMRSQSAKEEAFRYIITSSRGADTASTGEYESACELYTYTKILWNIGDTLVAYTVIPSKAPFVLNIDTVQFKPMNIFSNALRADPDWRL